MLTFACIALYLFIGAAIAIYLFKDFDDSPVTITGVFLTCLVGWPVYLVMIIVEVAIALFKLLYRKP